MIPYFGRAVPDYSIISSEIMDHIYTSFEHLLTEFNLPFLLVPKLGEYWGSTVMRFITRGHRCEIALDLSMEQLDRYAGLGQIKG